MAAVAKRWLEARARRGAARREIEGAQAFEGQQRFFEVTARTAAEGRLSRLALRAVRR